LKHLTTNFSGGTVDTTGSSDGTLHFVATGQSIAINGNSTLGTGRQDPEDVRPRAAHHHRSGVTLTSFSLTRASYHSR